MNVQNIILSYVNAMPLPIDIPSYSLETEVRQYGLQSYNIQHTPGTYSRIFRLMKRNNVFTKHGLDVIDVTSRYITSRYKGAKTKVWQIRPIISKSPSGSPTVTP